MRFDATPNLHSPAIRTFSSQPLVILQSPPMLFKRSTVAIASSTLLDRNILVNESVLMGLVIVLMLLGILWVAVSCVSSVQGVTRFEQNLVAKKRQ